MKIFGFGLAVVSMLAFSGAASFAQGSDFEKRKAERLADIDQRIQKMQEHRNCVGGAADYDALRKCRDSMRGWFREERLERQEKRDEKLEQKPARRGQP